MICSNGCRKLYFCNMCVFLQENKWFSRFSTFIFHAFSYLFSILFRHRFLDRFFMICGPILAQFSTLFRSFWHHFSIFFRCRCFDDLLMPFWTTFGPKSIIQLAIRGLTFFILFLVFPGPRSRGRFWTDFRRILMDFCALSCHFRSSFA